MMMVNKLVKKSDVEITGFEETQNCFPDIDS